MSYYNAELPYSDELFHYGIKEQKWGIRRFQNPDGTLTALGKVHYGAMKAAKKTAKTVARTAKRAALNFAGKHLRWAMSDEQLKEYTNRLVLENAYKKAIADSKASKGRDFAAKILYTVGDKLVSAGADNIANNIRAKNNRKIKERDLEFQDKLDAMKKSWEEAREEKKNSKKESYRLANATLEAVRNPVGGRTLTNEQLELRLERINMLRSIEDPSVKAASPITIEKMKKNIK